MIDSFASALDKVHSSIGQGSVLEQVDKLYRKQQRLTLFQMLEIVCFSLLFYLPHEIFFFYFIGMADNP